MIDIVGGVFRDILFYGQTHANDVLEMAGGTGYNVFAGLREIGIKANFHCAVGDDWPFESLNHVNGKSGIFVCANEKNVLAIYRGINLSLPIEEVKSKILFATLECGGSVFEKYAKQVKNAGGMVILDPSPIFEWKDKYVDLCDILIPNEKEFERISPPKSKKVFLKLGEYGGKYIDGFVEISQRISQRGDFPLGCGDAFDVGVIYGLIKGKKIAEIIKIAVELGQKTSLFRGSSSAVIQSIDESRHLLG